VKYSKVKNDAKMTKNEYEEKKKGGGERRRES